VRLKGAGPFSHGGSRFSAASVPGAGGRTGGADPAEDSVQDVPVGIASVPCTDFDTVEPGFGVMTGVRSVVACKFKLNKATAVSASHKCKAKNCSALFHNLCGLKEEWEDENVACSDKCMAVVQRERLRQRR
jgi:hypothetical protein